MAELVADCPRCGSKRITFDLRGHNVVGYYHSWQNWYEAFCICRHCGGGTIFVLSERVDGNYEYVHKVGLAKIESALNSYVTIERFVSLKDTVTTPPPEHLPKQVKEVFEEGATCLAVGCYNAAGTMFRLCVDLATRPLLPTPERLALTPKFAGT
jgi:hypothetical protein